MSIDCLSWVMRNSEAQLGPRLVLFVLAEHAHNDGSESYPSVDVLVRETRLSRRSVQAALRRLEADDCIRRDGLGSKGQSKWIVVMEGGAKSAPAQDPQGADNDVGGAQITTEGGEAASPEPSVNRPEQPSTTAAVGSAREPWEFAAELQVDGEVLLTQKRKVDAKIVTEAEMRIAAAAVAEFNRQMGSDYGLGSQLTSVVMRIRERPSWDAAAHVRLVQSAWRFRWWERTGNSRRPAPNVIYSERAFENVVQDASDEAAGRKVVDDLRLDTKMYDGRRWDQLTPAEQAHAKEAMSMGIKPWEKPPEATRAVDGEPRGVGLTADNFLDEEAA